METLKSYRGMSYDFQKQFDGQWAGTIYNDRDGGCAVEYSRLMDTATQVREWAKGRINVLVKQNEANR